MADLCLRLPYCSIAIKLCFSPFLIICFPISLLLWLNTASIKVISLSLPGLISLAFFLSIAFVHFCHCSGEYPVCIGTSARIACTLLAIQLSLSIALKCPKCKPGWDDLASLMCFQLDRYVSSLWCNLVGLIFVSCLLICLNHSDVPLSRLSGSGTVGSSTFSHVWKSRLRSPNNVASGSSLSGVLSAWVSFSIFAILIAVSIASFSVIFVLGPWSVPSSINVSEVVACGFCECRMALCVSFISSILIRCVRYFPLSMPFSAATVSAFSSR